jgi:hypothetical protein
MAYFSYLATFLCLILLSPALAGAATMSIRTLEGKYTLTFDPSHISKSRLKKLYGLSPQLYWQLAIPPALQVCVKGDREYLPCGTRDLADPNFLKNAETNLRKGHRILQSLGNSRLPTELDPVVGYVKRSGGFFVCLQERQLAFYRTWDPAALLAVCDGISTSVECPSIIDRANNSGSKRDKYDEADRALRNCMNEAFQKRLGEYPLEAWQRFLAAYGIKEAFIEDEVD